MRKFCATYRGTDRLLRCPANGSILSYGELLTERVADQVDLLPLNSRPDAQGASAFEGDLEGDLGAFQRMVQRLRPSPVGSRLISAM